MNLVLAAVGGYDWEALAPFVQSLRRVYRDAVVFCDYGFTEETRGALQAHGIELWRVPDPVEPREIPHDRMRAYRAFLGPRVNDYDRVLLTDVRDVVFQADPFAFDTGPGLMVFCEEAPIEADPDCNMVWIRDCYGEAMVKKLAKCPILCAGTTMGTAEAILQYVTRMDTEMGRAKGKTWGWDQGVHNVLCWTEPLDTAYAKNGYVVLTLALVPPERIAWTEDEELATPEGDVPAVIHQYDRHPILAGLMRARYGC